MDNVIIQTAEDLKKFYLQTDIADISSVQSAIEEVSSRAYIGGSDKYLVALNTATPANLIKAKRYIDLNTSPILKNMGWVLMAIFGVLMAVVDSNFEDAITTWLSLGFWVGVAAQIYIATLKNVWEKLTLSGSVIHPALQKGTARVNLP